MSVILFLFSAQVSAGDQFTDAANDLAAYFSAHTQPEAAAKIGANTHYNYKLFKKFTRVSSLQHRSAISFSLQTVNTFYSLLKEFSNYSPRSPGRQYDFLFRLNLF